MSAERQVFEATVRIEADCDVLSPYEAERLLLYVINAGQRFFIDKVRPGTRFVSPEQAAHEAQMESQALLDAETIAHIEFFVGGFSADGEEVPTDPNLGSDDGV